MIHAMSTQDFVGAVQRFVSETGTNLVFNMEFGEITIETEDEQVLMAIAEPQIVKALTQRFMIDTNTPERIEANGWARLWDA